MTATKAIRSNAVQARHAVETVEAFLIRPPTAMKALMCVCGVLLLVAVIMGIAVSIDTYIQVKGIVRPAGGAMNIRAGTDGEVLEVAVKEGQQVDRDQVLVRIATRDSMAMLERAKQQLAMSEMRLKQLGVLRDGLARKQRAAELKEDRSLSSAGLHVDIARARQERATHALEEADVKVSLAASEKRRFAHLSELAVASDVEVEEKAAKLKLSEFAKDGSRAELSVTDEELRLASESLRLQEAEVQSAIEDRFVAITELQLRLLSAEAEVAEWKHEVKKLEADIAQLAVRAPFAGTITALRCKHAGELVSKGQDLVVMASDAAPWIVEAFVPDRDSGFLQEAIGQRVRLRFEAFPYSKYGALYGEIVGVDVDAVQKPGIGQAVRIEIAIGSRLLSEHPRHAEIRLGMLVDVGIPAERRGIWSFLIGAPTREDAG